MSLSNTTTKVVYKPDGVQVRFDITFPLFDSRDIERIGVDPAGIETKITGFDVVGMDGDPAVVFDTPRKTATASSSGTGRGPF